jgi:hypothetical protein
VRRACALRVLPDFAVGTDHARLPRGSARMRRPSHHTVPYPLGPTHASNLKLLCRMQARWRTLERGDRILEGIAAGTPRSSCRSDGEEAPLAGHALQLVRAAFLELDP